MTIDNWDARTVRQSQTRFASPIFQITEAMQNGLDGADVPSSYVGYEKQLRELDDLITKAKSKVGQALLTTIVDTVSTAAKDWGTAYARRGEAGSSKEKSLFENAVKSAVSNINTYLIEE